MKKFDFFNQYISPVIVVRDYEKVVFRNNTFCRVFNNFDDIRKFAHRMNFEVCPMDSENVDLCSPIFQAITSKENFFARVYYSSVPGQTVFYDLTAIKRGAYTIIVLVDVSSDVLLKDNQKEREAFQDKLTKLEEENEELQKIRLKAQAQAIRIALINKLSNIIRESMDISVILNSALRELAIMFGCFKTYYAQRNENGFEVVETFGENNFTGKEISFDAYALKQLMSDKISISYSLSEYVGAEPFKQSVLRVIVPVFHMQKMIGALVLLSYQKRELNEEIEILDAVSSQLGNAIIRAELYQKNAKNVKDLKAALDELKETQLQLINSEKMASLGQLIASVAHEINTPLGAINANNEMMQGIFNKFDKNMLEMLKEMNNVDREAIKRITNIVQSLRRFVRLDETDRQEANINQEIDLTLDLIHHKIKKGYEITKDYGDITLINCYPNMLNQVFLNILMNGIQSIQDVKKNNPDYIGKIKIKTQIEDNYLKIQILDNGKGISKSNKDKVFSAGFTTKKKGQGTGLGLAICKKIIEKHKGDITFKSGSIENEPDYKTVFEIKIPL